MKKNEIIKNRYSKGDPFAFSHMERYQSVMKTIATLSLPENAKVLDIGCRDGEFCEVLSSQYPQFQLHGVDLSEEVAKKTREKGVEVIVHDIEDGPIPFEDNFFDLVFSGEVIEHLYDTDHFLEEANRVLKPGRSFILTTPNLASWYNRFIFLPLGWQPSSSEVSSRYNVGRPFIKYRNTPPGHIHLFVWRSLKEMLLLYGFEITALTGTIAANHPILKLIDVFFAKYLPSLAAGFIVCSRKKQPNKTPSIPQ